MRHVRRLAAWLGILAIVFAQAAAAAYACPGAGGAEAGRDMAMPCPEMDPATPNLCERHCHGDEQRSATPTVALPVFVATFAVEPVLAAAPAWRSRALPAPPPAASPPLAYRNRFRL